MDINYSPRNEKQVVFITRIPTSRVLKLSIGLRNRGWEVILFFQEEPSFDYRSTFNGYAQYSTELEALFLCAQCTPQVYHFFTSWQFNVSAFLTRIKPGKIIVDDYDVLGGTLVDSVASDWAKDKIIQERYTLENADALCCRSLEYQIVKKELDYQLPEKKLFFPDYAWGNLISQERYPVRKSKEIVYCGNLWYEGCSPAEREYMLKIAAALAQSGFSLHLYPSRDNFVFGMPVPENITVHKPVPADALVKELSQYSAGLQIPFGLARAGISQYNLLKPKASMAGKIFDYIDARIPVIICDQLLQRRILEHYKVAVPLDIDNPLKSLAHLSEEQIASAQKHTEKAARDLSLMKHIPRLEKLYRDVHNR